MPKLFKLSTLTLFTLFVSPICVFTQSYEQLRINIRHTLTKRCLDVTTQYRDGWPGIRREGAWLTVYSCNMEHNQAYWGLPGILPETYKFATRAHDKPTNCVASPFNEGGQVVTTKCTGPNAVTRSYRLIRVLPGENILIQEIITGNCFKRFYIEQPFPMHTIKSVTCNINDKEQYFTICWGTDAACEY